MSEVLLVVTTLPDRATAERIAEALVTARVAACVNVLAECTSVYRWQGKIERAGEVPMLIKTTRDTYAKLEETLRSLHPYDVPEIIAMPITAGLPLYLDWVTQETKLNQG
jgi:periplasmic divalent cation tolerance protein